MSVLQLDDFSSLAYLADASVTCSELEAQRTKGDSDREERTENHIDKGGGHNVLMESGQTIGQSEQPTVVAEEVNSSVVELTSKAMKDDLQEKSEKEPNNEERAPKDGDEAATSSGCRDCMSLSLKDLAQHIISKHKGPTGFTCDFCNTLFASSVSFGKHILGHVINASGNAEHENEGGEDATEDGKKAEKENDGTYHCSTCDKRFSSYLDLQRHLSLHKSYVCAVCDKGFSRPVVFKKHMQIHSREEVRMCEAERDQLYEEIKAAAAGTKFTGAELPVVKEKATDEKQSADDEGAGSKRKKRKPATPKIDEEIPSVTIDTTQLASVHVSKKNASKRSGEKKVQEVGGGGKRRRTKTSQENKGNNNSLKNDDGEIKVEEKENTIVIKGESSEGMAAVDLPVQSSDCRLLIEGESSSEVKGDSLSLIKEGMNTLMEGITSQTEASTEDGGDSVILMTSAFVSEDEEELDAQAILKDDADVKSDPSFRIIITKEREKGRRAASKRSSSYKCSQCPAEFKSRLEARDHERQTHNAVLPWQCETCGEGFWSSSQFKKHSLIEHNDNTPFKCEHCGKKLSGPGILRTHLGIHTGIRPYACHICSRDFLTRTNLQDHLIKHANPRGYCCHLCPSKFNLRTDLSSHIRTVHENIRPWKCEHCEYAFPRQSALLRHMRTHTGEKPHKCEFCGKTFARVENCMEHRRIHTGERPHVCEICGKTFKDSGNFSNHRKIHKDGYVPRRKKKATGKSGEDIDKLGDIPSPGKPSRGKSAKQDSVDSSKAFGVVGADGKVVGTAFESLGSAVAALGSDGRVAFESLGSAVAALIGNSLPVSSAGANTSDATGVTMNNAEVEAAISGALVAENDTQQQTITVGAENIALTTYPTGVMQGSAVPTATLHDIVNAATMSATMVSSVPAQSETEVQEAMAHSNTFLQIGNFLFSLDVDNGLKTLNQVGNMGEFLTLSLAGAQVEADGQTVITQPHQTEAMTSQEGVQHVQIGVLPDEGGRANEDEEIQIQAIVGNTDDDTAQHANVTSGDTEESMERPALLTCVVNDPNIVQQLQGAAESRSSDPVSGPLKRELEQQVTLTGAVELHTAGTHAAQGTEEMQTILPRTEV